MKVESIDITKLKPLEKNVRNHAPTQIQELVRSYQQFGQTRPLVVDEDNNILIGNGFYEAVKSTGASKIEIYRITGLSEIEKKEAYSVRQQNLLDWSR
jgi:ParB-like chromosome segregation protein Spo0J